MKKLLFPVLLLTILVGCKKDWLDYSPIDMYSAKIEYDDSGAYKFLSVAAVSIQPSKTDKDSTLANIKSMVEKIIAEHSDIQVIVFGEMMLGWYYDDEKKDAYQIEMSEPIPGNSTAFIQNLASANNVNIVVGLTENDSIEGKLYNSQVLVRPSGEIIKYRKRNLNQTDIDNGITAGNEFVTADIDGVKVALFICSDMQSASISREMASSDVDVILHSLTSSTDLNAEISYVGLQMNKWIVFANRFGTEGDFSYTGFVQIINPVGSVSERAEGKDVYVFRKLGIY